MTKPKSKPSAPGTDVFHRHRQEYQRYLHLTEAVQSELSGDVEELRAQEGWDEETSSGVQDWIEDKDSIWRLLRRHRYDETKAHAALLTGLAKRISLSLHRPIPSIPPYSDSPLCYVLPLPRYTDRMGRPVVVLTLREVRRDENGKMDDMKEWSWWALEMVRRSLRDYWTDDAFLDKGEGRGIRGKGGEGCVILVDAARASYRNLEVEMLPTLLAVGHNHFPGIFDAVYVVNAGWTHRSMWGVVKRVLPKSALDKVIFLDKEADVEKVFDLDNLPKDLGGRDELTFETSNNPILRRYSTPIPTIRHDKNREPSRSPSSSSIADVYYSAQNTPSSSRRQSLTAGLGLHMSRGPGPIQSTTAFTDGNQVTTTDMQGTHTSDISANSLSRQQSRASSTGEGPIQRIKSLTDFHLYLSPSRLAHIDVLSDSDSDSEAEMEAIPPPIPTKRLLRPAVLETDGSDALARRQRPRLQLLGKLGDEDVRSYSDRLQQHHAQVLQTYKSAFQQDAVLSHLQAPKLASIRNEAESPPPRPSTPSSATTPGPPVLAKDLPDHASSSSSNTQVQPISAFSSNINPWYGYPAILAGTTVRPRYQRNRKRDLVKTLLFLFILRIQSWRDAFERFLGLNGLGTWGYRSTSKAEIEGPKDPSQGLVSVSSSSEVRKVSGADKDWIWMAVTFLLLRGTWVRILGGPLEAVGLRSVRDMLGLV